MARIEKRSIDERHLQKRGWGREHWIENLDEYCGKILVIDPGKRGSMHFHVNKMETMLVIEGQMHLFLVDPDDATSYVQELSPGDSILIPRGQVHQIVNPNQSVELKLIEFSTKHEESDSRRIVKGD